MNTICKLRAIVFCLQVPMQVVAAKVASRTATTSVQVVRNATFWNTQHNLWVLAFTAFITLVTIAALIAFRMRTREQIANRREHARLILDSANDAFVETDSDGRILEWNKRAEHVFGWKRGEALRKTFADTMIPERFRPIYLARLAELQQKTRSDVMDKPVELKAMDRHGRQFQVNLTIWSVEGEGRTTFTAFVRKISQRQFDEDLLKRTEEFDRQILENSTDCIEVLDHLGNLISINARGCQLREIENVDRVVSKWWPSFWPESAREKAEEALRNAQLGGEGVMQDFRPAATGSSKWWDVRVTAMEHADGVPDRLLVISRDVTTQRTAERALEATESRLQEAQEIAHLGHWDFDLIAGKITWSEELYRIFRIPNKTIVTYEFYQSMLPAEDRDSMLVTIDRAIATGEAYELTHQATLNDGSLIYIEAHGTPQRDANGRTIRLSGTLLDVTSRVESVLELQRSSDLLEQWVEQRTAELATSKTALQESMQAVQRSEAEFRQLADSMPQIVWTSRPDGALDYYNERWYTFTGFDRELVGDQRGPLLHPEDFQKCIGVWSESVRSGATYQSEYRFWDRATETYRWYLGRALPSFGEDGRIAKWVGTCTDIDDYKRAETEILALNRGLESRVAERTAELSKANEELRRAQSWLRAVLNSATQASIIAIDNDGIISLFNSGAEKLLGYSADELVGKHTPRLLHSEEYCRLREQRLIRELHTEHIENIFAGHCQPKDSVVSEVVYIHRDGTQIDVSLATTPMVASGGERLGSLGIGVDISPRKLLERKLNENNEQLQEQTKCAEDANRAKSQFLAAMSHEIRTPMNAILGMADLLWESDLDLTQRKYVEVFRRAGAQLLTLVNDILDVSRIESGQFELEQVDFDLAEAVERTVELVRPKTEAKQVGLVSQVAPGTPVNVSGDPTRLQQVLINLLGNAVKFTERGEITLTVTPDPDDSCHLHFEVTDTGIGIPANKLDSIFDDFTQAESSTTRRFGGTGLGLGICRRLVNRMGGHLDVTSELGTGSSFFFDAVFGKSNEETKTSAAEAVVGLTGRKVLIVDNNETNRLIFMEMCIAWGMVPSECPSAEKAVTVLRNAKQAGRPFDLVILDRLMPGQDGFELISRIRLIDSRIALILATSDKIPGDETRCRQLGLAGYAVKPVARGELLRMIRKALGASSGASARVVSRPHPGRILIAEDSEDNRFLLQAYLRDSRYNLTFVANGELAVEAARSRSFDLVLMDMQMPVMDGLTATRLIREEEAALSQSPVPIVALTANARAEDFQASREAGCDSHLSKPISKAGLLNAVAEFVRAMGTAPEMKSLRIDLQPGLEEGAKRYIESRKKEVPGLMGLIQAQEFNHLRVIAHNIKGTGTSYGFPDLTRLGEQIEISASERDAATLSKQLLELHEYVEQASVELDRLVLQGD